MGREGAGRAVDRWDGRWELWSVVHMSSDPVDPGYLGFR